MSDYPRMLYRAGTDPNHVHISEPLLVQGRYDVETRIVEDETAHVAALEDGWFDSPAATAPADDAAPRRQRKEVAA